MRGRVVMITGASSGIGEATARACAANGATVVITSEKAEDLQKVADSIISDCAAVGGRAFGIAVDFSSPDQTAGLFARAESLAGPVDTLINNAGIGMRALVGERSMEDTRFLFEVNFFALASLCAQALDHMSKRGSGRIINISSAAGQFGCANMSSYSASKGAVHAYTQALRGEALAHGIFVSEVVPISVRTPFFDNAKGKAYKPLGVVLTPESVAHSIVKCACKNRPSPEIWPYMAIRMVFLANVLAPGILVAVNFRTFLRNRRAHNGL